VCEIEREKNERKEDRC
jgi:hypothetical protein